MNTDDKKYLAQVLDKLITTVLGGPSGDPDFNHNLAAAYAIVLIEDLDLPKTYIRHFDETKSSLQNKDDNLLDYNFIAEARTRISKI